VKREPQIFNTLQMQDEPVDTATLDMLEDQELSEAWVREYVRVILSESSQQQGRLNEGILDFLGDMFKGLGGAFNKVKIDTGKFETYGVDFAEIDPKRNAEEQFWATLAVIQTVGYAVGSTPLTYLEDAKETLEASDRLKNLPQSDEEMEDFAEEFSRVIDDVASSFGLLVKWLTDSLPADKPWFRKFSAIGDAAKPGKNATETLENMADAVKKIEAFNIPGETEKILASDAVKAVLTGDDETALVLARAAKKIPEYLQNVQKIGYLKTLIDEVHPLVKEIEEVMEEYSKEEAPPEPEQTSLLAHHLPGDDTAALREYIRAALNEGVEFREVDSPLSYNRGGHVKRLALCDTSVTDPPHESDYYFADVQEWERRGKTGRPLKKPRKGQLVPGVDDDCVIGFLDYHSQGTADDGAPMWYIDYMKTRDEFGGQKVASRLVDEFFRRHASEPGSYVHFGKMMHPSIGHLKDKMAEKYPENTVIGAVNYR
jgi:hypothetical protein